MLSNKPYLTRAFYDWIIDSGCTPIVVLNANHPKSRIPVGYADNGEIVFNISPSAVRDLMISKDGIEFTASFSGVINYISAPMIAINAVYAEENGEGVFFDGEENEEDEIGGGVHLRGIESSANLSALSQDTSSSHGAETLAVAREKPVLRLIE